MLDGPILFLSCWELDFLQESTFSGLYKLLGERIVEHPRRPPWQAGSGYPLDISFVGERHNGMSWRQIVREEWALIVVGSCKKEPLTNYLRLLEANPALRSTPSVLVDGGDSKELAGDRRREFAAATAVKPFDVVFKREMDREREDGGVYSLSFSVNLDTFPAPAPDTPRDLDVCFACRPTNPLRATAVEELSGRFPASVVHLETRRPRKHPLRRLLKHFSRRYERRSYHLLEQCELPPDRYVATLGRSRVGVSIPGGGFDTYRYWEIPAAGALLCSMRPTIFIRDDFVPGAQAVYVDEPGELVPTIRSLLAEPERLAEIARNGNQHLRRHHTDVARAAYVLEVLRDVLRKAGVRRT